MILSTVHMFRQIYYWLTKKSMDQKWTLHQMQLNQVETKQGHVEKCLLKCGFAPMLASRINVCGPAHHGRHGANKKMRNEVHGCFRQDCTWNWCLIIQEANPSGRSAFFHLHGYNLAPYQINCQQRRSCHVATFHCLNVIFLLHGSCWAFNSS